MMGTSSNLNGRVVAGQSKAADNGEKVGPRGLNSDILYEIPDIPQSYQPYPPFKRRKTTSSRPVTLPGSRSNPQPPLNNQQELFSNAAIIKATGTASKWITTEEVLSTKSIGPGKTSLEKLSAFKYHATKKQPPIEMEVERSHPSIEAPSDGPHLVSKTPKILGDDFDLNLDCVYDETNRFGPPVTIIDDDDEVHITSEQQILPLPDLVCEEEFPFNEEDEAEMVQLSVFDTTTARQWPQELQSCPPKERESEFSKNDINHHRTFPPSSRTLSAYTGTLNQQRAYPSVARYIVHQDPSLRPLQEAVEWGLIHHNGAVQSSSTSDERPFPILCTGNLEEDDVVDAEDEYAALPPFARPNFPPRVKDHSPIMGVSASVILRTCFRIGEVLREGSLCFAFKQDAVMELFARVMSCSREPVTHKQHFQFADLFHERPPFLNGVQPDPKGYSLQATESRVLDGVGLESMVRCLGKLKKAPAESGGWLLDIINIRKTDWEEIRWTKGIAGAGMK